MVEQVNDRVKEILMESGTLWLEIFDLEGKRQWALDNKFTKLQNAMNAYEDEPTDELKEKQIILWHELKALGDEYEDLIEMRYAKIRSMNEEVKDLDYGL
jgi:hypothetical protein